MQTATHEIDAAVIDAEVEGQTVASRWLDTVAATIEHDRPVAPPVSRPRVVDPLTPFKEWRAAVARSPATVASADCRD